MSITHPSFLNRHHEIIGTTHRTPSDLENKQQAGDDHSEFTK